MPMIVAIDNEKIESISSIDFERFYWGRSNFSNQIKSYLFHLMN